MTRITCAMLLVAATLHGGTAMSQSSFPAARREDQKLPTGVVTSGIPKRPGVIAHGPGAQKFVASVYGSGGDFDDADEPWLVLFGPPDATNQIEKGLPAEVLSKIQVQAYDPDTDEGRLKLREMEVKVGGRGVKALVMDAGGNVAYEGLYDRETILDELAKLLGLDKEPDDGGDDDGGDDDGGWFPRPFRREWWDYWFVLLPAGFALGYLFRSVAGVFSGLVAFAANSREILAEIRRRQGGQGN